MGSIIQVRRDVAANWTSTNPTLAQGEMGHETDTGYMKIGTGIDVWTALPYFNTTIVEGGTLDGQTLRWETTSGAWEANSSLIVADSGNVGIGTNAPLTKLELEGSDANNLSLLALSNISGVGSTQSSQIIFRASSNRYITSYIRSYLGAGVTPSLAFGTANTGETGSIVQERVLIDSTGNVLIGINVNTTGRSAKLFVEDSGNAAIFNRTVAGSSIIEAHLNGSLVGYANQTGDWTTVSDARAKEDIVDLHYGLAEVLQLQPRAYTLLASGLGSIGFIAQEAEGVVPESVDYDAEADRYGMAYTKLVPVLVKAIQELTAKVEALEARL